MVLAENTAADDNTSTAAPVKPDYSKDKNVNKRLRAGKRSSARNAGKEITDVVSPDAEVVPPEGGPTPEDVPTAPEVSGEGIVGEAEQELAVATAAVDEAGEGDGAETSAETSAIESAEPPTEEAVETPAEEAAETPALSGEPSEAPSEPTHTPVGEYEAPDGEYHEDLIDQYHEALMFGDKETAKALYRKLQNHRYSENVHRTKSEAQAEREAQAFVDTARRLAAAHPELAEDGLETDKVMALADLYRSHGIPAAEALQKAVDDLYSTAPVSVQPTEAAPTEAVPATPVSEVGTPAEPAKPVVPDMTERKAAKRNIPAVPSATVRNEPAPGKPEPTRSDAIAQIKKSRGQ
jgi:hypothetical protein